MPEMQGDNVVLTATKAASQRSRPPREASIMRGVEV